MSRHLIHVLAFSVLCALCALPALADITLGGDARAVGMGGAGLASGDAPGAATINPAFLADTGMRLGIQMPTVNARMQGATYGDVFDLLGKQTINPSTAMNLALTLGDQPTSITAAGSTGLLLPRMDVLANATMHTVITPNAAFQGWVRGGGVGVPPVGASADLTAGGVAHLPSLGFGMHVPMGGSERGTLALGVRLKPTQAYYSHYIVDGAAIAAQTPQLAPEMGGRNYLKKTSFSADMGLMYTPPRMADVRMAVVVDNLIEPKAIDFGAFAPPGVNNKQLSPRTVSLGVAMMKRQMTLAADLVDVTRALGDPQLRVGAELRLPAGMGIRGGYNTATGFSAGVGLGSLGLAYSQRMPVMLSQAVVF